MTLTVNFTSNQQGIVAGATLTQVRFWDKSITTNGVVVSWLWKFGDNYTWIPDGPTNPTWVDISGASTTIFQVDDRVWFTTSAGGTVPGSLSTSTLYWVKTVQSLGGYTIITVSTTQGGTAVTANGGGSGTFYIQHGSVLQNPIASYRSIAAGTYTVALTCDDSGSTGATTTTKTGYINAVTLAFSKPTNGGLFGRITIFIYDSTNATAINRLKSTNNNLFFQELKCSSSITKAGTASFKVYTNGASATELGLLVADKNVAIISGRDVIWSGKISRAIQEKQSLYDSGTFMSWNIECDSDISKMRYQNVKTANQIAYNAPPGYIINKLVEPAVAGDIDWRGAVTPSLISYEGANIQYTITSADMQSQFLTIANLTGYDWRTRNDWMKYAYGVNGYVAAAKTVTVAAIAPYIADSFIGKWLLFPNATETIVTLTFIQGGVFNGGNAVTVGETLTQQSGTVHGTVLSVTLVSGSWALGTAAGTISLQETDGIWISGQFFDASVAGANSANVTAVAIPTNTTGIRAYGLITHNTTTVLTMTTITNSGVPPVSSDNVIILGKPVLDFSSDFRQPTYVSTFTMNKARASTLQNGYEMNDMSDFKQVITKIIAKGKSLLNSLTTGLPHTITASFAAKDAWNSATNFFENSTFITQKTEGYVIAYTVGDSYIDVIGTGYALVSGNKIYVYAIGNDGSLSKYGVLTLNGVTTGVTTDGTAFTRLSCTAVITTNATGVMKYSAVVSDRIYVKDSSVIYTGGDNFVGTEKRTLRGIGVDAAYGPYAYVSGTGDLGVSGVVIPHYPGCIVSQTTYTEVPFNVQTGSPLNFFGIILKTATTDQTVTISDLEIYATNYLINHSFYYRKGTFWAFVYDWFKPDIRAVNEVSENGWLRAGDEICILQHTGDAATDLQYGQYKNQWQVVGWTLDADQMTVLAELGDFERNTNTLINDKTAGINYTIT